MKQHSNWLSILTDYEFLLMYIFRFYITQDTHWCVYYKYLYPLIKIFVVINNIQNSWGKHKANQTAYTRKRFPSFLYCLLFSRESRTTSSLLETIQKRRKTFPCARGLYTLWNLLTSERILMNIGFYINREHGILYRISS